MFISNPLYDYIEPYFIKRIITNEGSFKPNMIRSQFASYFDMGDDVTAYAE